MHQASYTESEKRHTSTTLDECIDVNYSIQNRCEAIYFLDKFVPKSFAIDHILHTLFEDNFIDIMRINEGFCIEERDVDTKLMEGAP